MSHRRQQKVLQKDFCTILIDSNPKDLINEEHLDTYECASVVADFKSIGQEDVEVNYISSDEANVDVDVDSDDNDYQYFSDNGAGSEGEYTPSSKRQKVTEKIEAIDIVLLDEITNCTDEQFHQTFGLRKSSLEDLIAAYATSKQYAHHHIKGITAEREILVYVYYLMHTESLSSISQQFGIERRNVRKILKRCMDFITTEQRHYIKWPSDLAKAAKDFSAIANMPGVIGALACADIKLNRTRVNEKKTLYFNEKLNEVTSRMLAVFDANKKFSKVFIGAPGSFSNATLLAQTSFVTNPAERQRRFGNYFILGDATFPCSSWLIKPFERQDANSLVAFNEMHAKTLLVAVQSMHLFRKRFPIVFDFVDYINFKYVNNLILSACILHNMLIDKNDVLPVDDFVCDESKEDEEEELDFRDEFIERRAQLLDILIKRNVIKE